MKERGDYRKQAFGQHIKVIYRVSSVISCPKINQMQLLSLVSLCAGVMQENESAAHAMFKSCFTYRIPKTLSGASVGSIDLPLLLQ